MSEVDLARSIAEQAHAGQVDKADQPYIGHVERVVANLIRAWPDATEHEIAAAWLHDVVEDTGIDGHEMLAAGLSRQTVAIVYELTRSHRQRYLEWVAEMAAWGSLSAVRVNLADNEDNSDPMRVEAIPNGAQMLEQRYQPARELLLKRLEHPCSTE